MKIASYILNQTPSKGHTYKQWLFVILANFALFVYGAESSWVSPMTKILQAPDSPAGEPLSDYAISWIAGLMCFAAMLGTPIYAYVADNYGRKIAVMCIFYPQAMSWALKLYPTPVTLTLSRIFGGISAGGCFNVVPMYVKEISQDSIRGVLGSLLILSQNLGVLFMYIIGAYLDYYTVQWAILGLPIVASVLMFIAPEAPVYLVKQGKMDEAIETVASLRGLDKSDKTVQDVVDWMKKEDEESNKTPNIPLTSILIDKKWRRSIIIIFVVTTLYGLSGAFSITVYAFTLLSYAGAEFEISPEVQSFSFPIVMISASFVLALTIERVGRKPILVGAYMVSAISFSVIATSFLIKNNGGAVPGWLPLSMMISCVFCFAGGIESIIFILIPEMFSFQICGKIMGVFGTYTWFIEFFQLLLYAPIIKLFGYYILFYFYATINLVSGVFILIFIAETKGKTEQEVQNAINSKRLFKK
ncbi:facilitated trehalose transporter Tret1-like isoform X3 [Pieris napi]|uniref:facilitated trehalose transporter Tret1-like isoform X3 n=1 Tax=Pieris napi TaxID=78633 RepID=UPI001FBB994B|nr:facilitated trehalose transporter Tret1-like isoform X3 [Pieris napi]